MHAPRILFLLVLSTTACDDGASTGAAPADRATPAPASAPSGATPAEKPPAVPPEAQAAIDRAREHYRLNDPFAAVAELEKAVELAPRWAEAHRFLGKLQVQLSSVWFGTPTVDKARLAIATRELLLAHELEPAHADGCYWAGRALVMGERPEAEKMLLEAVRLDPKHGLATKELAALYATAGDVGAARVQLERAEALLPHDNEIPFQLGLQLEALGEADAAVQAHLRSLAIDPAHQGPRSRLVSLYQRAGRTEDADREAAALERWRAFGEELRAATDRSRAAPREAGPMIEVAELYRGVGMEKAARDWYGLALQREPGNERATRALQELGGAPGSTPATEVPK